MNDIYENLEDESIVKAHQGYPEKYVIIDNIEQFNQYKGKKFKVAWLNDTKKLCLRSFIYISPDRDDDKQYLAVDVINGIAKKLNRANLEENKYKYEDIFNSSKLVFLGYLSNEEITEQFFLKLKQDKN